jgi:dephospho-CoA kinase
MTERRHVALTGGIGSGKSEVARLLARHGAVVVDSDALARAVVEPGTPGLAAVVRAFGTGVLAADGSLDRAALGRTVFADPQSRATLEGIVHPLVRERSAQLVDASPSDAVVVHDIPLLVEAGLAGGFRTVVVVEADEGVRLARLAHRGLDEADARARMAAQATDSERREVATHVLRNDGSLAELAGQVDALWSELAGPLSAGPVNAEPVNE